MSWQGWLALILMHFLQWDTKCLNWNPFWPLLSSPPIAPGSTPDTAYVDVAPTTVPAEPTYEEDWEVFDPWVWCCRSYYFSVKKEAKGCLFIPGQLCSYLGSLFDKGFFYRIIPIWVNKPLQVSVTSTKTSISNIICQNHFVPFLPKSILRKRTCQECKQHKFSTMVFASRHFVKYSYGESLICRPQIPYCLTHIDSKRINVGVSPQINDGGFVPAE